MIGHTHPPPYPIEYGYKAEFENMVRNQWGYEWAGVDDKGNSAKTQVNVKSHVPRKRVYEQGNLKQSWRALQLMREKDEKERLKDEYIRGLKSGITPTPSAMDTAIRRELRVDHIQLSAEDKEKALAEYKATLPPFHLDSLLFALRDDKKPNFNIEHVANLIQYNEVFCKNEQPKWRAELIKANGPAGTDDPAYGNLAKVTLWKWDVEKFGHWPVDAKREVVFNGENFMQKRPDGKRESINLEKWLEKKALERDPDSLNDPNWRYKKLWFELILQMEVAINLLT